jgi:hypothetical protein
LIPRVLIEGSDVSGAVMHESLRIHEDSQSRVPTAEFTAMLAAQPARWDEDRWDQAEWSIQLEELNRVTILDQNTGRKRFGGQLSYIDYSRPKPGRIFVKCRCAGYAAWLEHILVPFEDFGVTHSDQYILKFLIDKYAAGLLDSSGIEQILPVVALGVVENQTLRQVFDWIADLSNAWWSVTPEAKVLYRRPNAVLSPYKFTDDAPDGVTSFKFSLEGFSRDFARPVNHAVVIGGVLADGNALTVQYSDPLSIDAYGRWSTTILDRGLTDANEAILRAQAVVQANAYPLANGSLVTYADEFSAGDYVQIETEDYAINDPFVLHSCEMKQLNRTTTQYTYGFGPRRPDAERLLRVLERFMRAEAGLGSMTGVSTPAAGSITEDMLDESFKLNANALYGSISGDEVTVAAGTIIGEIGGELVTVDAGTIQGVITGDDVHVDTGTFQGLIISDQLANGIIDDLGKFADSTRPIPVYEGMPTLPNADLPANAYFFNNANGHFYRVDAGGTTATDQGTNPDALAGTMKLYSIGKVNVQSFIGLIAANQIGSVNAGTIIGSITAGQSITIDASVLQGTVTAGQDVVINTSVLEGTISGTSVNIDANRVTLGVMQGTRVENLRGETINIGSVDSSRLNATEIRVGGGGSKPGKFTVFNSSGSEIGFIGVNGSSEGGWFKTLGVGGTTKDTPIIKADALGKVTITNADFTISTASNGSVNISTTTFDPTYSSVGLGVTDPSGMYKTTTVSKGVVGYYGANQLFSINVDPGAPTCGEMVLRNNGTIMMVLSGVSGLVDATRFAIRGAGNAYNIDIPIPGGLTIRIKHGLVYGYS